MIGGERAGVRLLDIERRVATLESYDTGQGAPAAMGAANSAFLSLNWLRAYWPMSSADESRNQYDLSGQGRTLTAVPAGGPQPYRTEQGAPLVIFNGTSQYLQRADEAGLDLTGSMAVGGWFYFANAASATEQVIGKRAGVGQLGYYLRRNGSGYASFEISSNGTATKEVLSGTIIPAETWAFLVGRFVVSSSVTVFVNGRPFINTTSIPASIFNSSAPFQISGYNGANELLDGFASRCFVCADWLSDAMVMALFEITRAGYGV
jgi:hypothetical protein